MSRRPAGVRPEPAGPGQESVWDYPRPPAVQPSTEHVVVELGGMVVVDTRRALRVLETSHPPGYYLPVTDVAPGALVAAAGTSVCEWKGVARYYDLVAGDARAPRAAWGYDDPWPGYEALRGHVALYPDRVERCLVEGERVRAQGGGFYGGWVTDRVVGPFKGAAGTLGW